MQNKKLRICVTKILLVALLSISLADSAYAEVMNNLGTVITKEEDATTESTSEATIEPQPQTFPYEAVFAITAYYSPLPDQKKYVTGSYEGDIRLNGRGTNGADGTPVYLGMIAAPSKYPFGTKMNILGIGVVSVHDRGGAIVHAGERGESYDRLDIWMGYGDNGLERALSWGKRMLPVTVYGVDAAKKEQVYLEGFSEAEKYVRKVVAPTRLFPQDVWYQSRGEDVSKLQRILKELGYYDGQMTGYYDDKTWQAVFEFQKDQNIVTSKTDFGAGHTGPTTRMRIEIALNEQKKTHLPKPGLAKGTEGEEVKKLQQLLQQLGYKVAVTGVYDDQTIDAVTKFQLDQGIVRNENEYGSGYFGPQTLTSLTKKFLALDKTVNAGPKEFLHKDLGFGDSGPEVIALQEELYRLHFLRIESTGYYGEVTEHAVFKFQQSLGLVGDISSPGAGIFGALTRERMNRIVADRLYTRQLIAAKKPVNVMVAQANILDMMLDPGARHEEVKNLQRALQKLGYYKGLLVSDFYGDSTKNAVLSFQLKEGIVKNPDDPGAGRFGPRTKALLNQRLNS